MKNKKKQITIYAGSVNQRRWLSLSCLIEAKIEAKARAKPNKGLGTCFSMFRCIKTKTEVDGSRRK
jgi:hypothetical protein